MATVCFPQNACHTSISDTNFLPTEKGTTYPGKYAGVFHEVATGTAPYLYLDEHNQVVDWLHGVTGFKILLVIFSLDHQIAKLTPHQITLLYSSCSSV